jgi:hypothetical protein
MFKSISTLLSPDMTCLYQQVRSYAFVPMIIVYSPFIYIKSQVMKKRPIATVASSGQGADWVMLWLTHLLIPWHLSFSASALRKPPARHRKKGDEAEQPTLAGFTESGTLRESTNYLSSG